MDPKYGFRIFFTAPGTKKNLITKIKSVELLKKRNSDDMKAFSPFGVMPGTTN